MFRRPQTMMWIMAKGPKDLINVVVVHSMGRVGSLSVKKALELAGHPNVIHTHHLMDVEGVYPKDEEARALIDGKGWGVVSVVRDPIARNLSAWWMNYKSDMDDPGDATDNFLEDYPHQIATEWFDWEIKGYWGVDVYERSPHHPRQAYGDQQLVVVRLEDFGRLWTQEMLSIFCSQPLPVPMPSEAGQTGYDYISFIANLALPFEYVNRMYSSQYARHFYSDVELEYFKQAWSGQLR